MALIPPQGFRKTEGIHRRGLAADRPAAADVLVGTLYFSTDTNSLDRSDGSTWSTYSGSGGSPGPAGPTGLIGPPGLDGTDGNDGLTIVGPAGAQGIQGIQGIQGPQGPQGTLGPPGINADEIEYPYIIPGPQGPQGLQGTSGTPGTPGIQGVIGPQGYQGIQGYAGEDGYDGFSIVGPQGPQGPAGVGGAASFTKFTKDLGAADRSGTFDITGLSGLTVDKVVTVSQTADPIASKGNARDEFEMDFIQLTGYVVDAATIRVYWNCYNVVVGTYAFAYAVSG
jgi:collagen triple helix repeat protein